jgi:hypothetical protein
MLRLVNRLLVGDLELGRHLALGVLPDALWRRIPATPRC